MLKIVDGENLTVAETAARAAELHAANEAILKPLETETAEVRVLRTDAVVAKELRDQIGPLLEQICAVISKARADGYEVAWVIQPDSFGRNMRCTEIAIKKQL